jgi:DNA-binding PadR family transcriptional regulator
MQQRPISHSLLGILSLRPMSGYDIRKFVMEHIGYFWRESYGQIYPMLKRMAAQGLVAARTETNHGKPDRQVYSLSSLGRAELEKWLAKPPAAPSPRNELLLKLFFGGRGKGADMTRHMEAFRQQHLELLQQYDRVEKWLRYEHPNHPDSPFWMITLDYGKRNSKNLLEWSEAALSTLNRLPSTTQSSKGKTRSKKEVKSDEHLVPLRS